MTQLFPAIFLDRDRTLNPDPGYISCPEDFALFPGVGEALKHLQVLGFKLIVITNQSGIGRGFFSEQDLASIHQKMRLLLRAYEVELDGIYYCPHRPEEDCVCRKPRPGMIFRAAKEHDVDLSRSWVIGDSDVDQGLATAIGCRFLRVDEAHALPQLVIQYGSALAASVRNG